MSVLVLVTTKEEAETLVPWGIRFAESRAATLSVLCWGFSPTLEFPLLADSEELHEIETTVAKVENVLKSSEAGTSIQADEVNIRQVLSPDSVVETVEQVKQEEIQLLIVGVADTTGVTGATYETNSILRESPCHTLAVYVDPSRSQDVDRILAVTADSVHDRIAVSLAARMSRVYGTHVSIATIEDEMGQEGVELGHRMLKQVMRESSVEQNAQITRHVFLTDETFRDVAMEADQNDLVLVAVNQQETVQKLVASTAKPTVAVLKRAPPLRRWWGDRTPEWIPRLNPADYADLVHGLRRGSMFSADFMIMQGLASAIASLGLLQDSPAVVIGSMLLAPLMTPMIGTGLALAQANARLIHTCFRSILSGFVLTLVISFVIGTLTPAGELTQQVISRGNPNLLDLFVALFSAVAAAYALARPSLLGAVAGVAIATALVPPLCSVGIALSYGNFLIASGAAVLFATNVVAIILAAAATFRLMGIIMSRAAPKTRRWVYRIVAVLCLATVSLSIPLASKLKRQIDFGRPQPLGYPLPKQVVSALLEKIEQHEGVDLMLAGRSSTINDDFDIGVWLSTREPLPQELIQEVTQIIHRELDDEELVVKVRSIKESWAEEDK